MIGAFLDYFTDLRDRQRIAISLAKGGIGQANRVVNLRNPASWEFSAFSQNGEDGILDVLASKLTGASRTFVEIGASDGVQNNSSWLAVVGRYRGLMVDGRGKLARRAARNIGAHNIGVESRCLFITVEKARDFAQSTDLREPDIFSLDIDGNDFHIARELFGNQFRPRIVVVEYNSTFGPTRSVAIPYAPAFDFKLAHPSELYYGASIAAWRSLFKAYGYRFVTVESNGVNAFFVDEQHFDSAFLESVEAVNFNENRYQLIKFGCDHSGQFDLISHLPLIEV